MLLSLWVLIGSGCASAATSPADVPESLLVQVSAASSDFFADAVSVAPRILVGVDSQDLGLQLAESGSSLRSDMDAAERLGDHLVRHLRRRDPDFPVMMLAADESPGAWDLVLDVAVSRGSRWVVRLDAYLSDGAGLRPETRVGSVTVGWENAGWEVSPENARVSAALVPLLLRTIGGPPLQFDRQRLDLPGSR